LFFIFISVWAYEKWLERINKDQSLKVEWQIFAKDSEGNIGTGPGARDVFRAIALKVRGFQKAGLLCGDLIHRILITVPDMSVTFPCALVKTNMIVSTSKKAGEISLFFDGLKKDLDDLDTWLECWLKTTLMIIGIFL